MLSAVKNLIKYFILLKRFPESKIYFGTFIDRDSQLGKKTVLFRDVILKNTQVGDYSYIQSSSALYNTRVDRFCSIAGGVQIGLPEHPTNMVSTNPVFYDNTQPLPFFFIDTDYLTNSKTVTTVNADVWIGYRAIIKAGVHIGVGAVVGAGAVVTKDVEPYSIVAGVPAKHIKYRFDKETREQLLVTKWWTLTDEKLSEIAKYFKNPKEMIEILNNEI
ncbi:CatB-related O-acetyltransferase [bacterium]|nr:CatB-related O-acetyltransferase [bacterium]MBU1883799.1 CatB-related O-acetyltransferase [bacterium]